MRNLIICKLVTELFVGQVTVRPGLLFELTLNDTGRVDTVVDRLGRVALDEIALRSARHQPTRVLDVATGFGLMTVQSFANGAEHVTAMDISQAHLDIVWRNVRRWSRSYVDRLTTVRSPFQVGPLNGPFDVIFIGRLAHLLSPEDFVLGLRRLRPFIHESTVLFASAATPYTPGIESFLTAARELYPRVNLLEPVPFVDLMNQGGWIVEHVDLYGDPITPYPAHRRDRVGIRARPRTQIRADAGHPLGNQPHVQE